MPAAVTGGRATPIGREPELALLLDFLDRLDGAGAGALRRTPSGVKGDFTIVDFLTFAGVDPKSRGQ